MPLWNETELKACRSLVYPTFTEEEMLQRFKIWGGVPRCLFLSVALTVENEFQEVLKDA